MEVIKI